MSAPASAARAAQSMILSQFPAMSPTEVLIWAREMRRVDVGTGLGVMRSGYSVLV